MQRAKIGLVGCGDISGIYCQNAKRFNNLEIVSCASLHLERARAKAAKHGIPKACSVAELIADPEVDVVLNLTVPAVHAEITLQALEAGKHVYTEKPLALTRADGARILALAREKGLRVGCAPDTFLGAGLQTCRQVIDEGLIGVPVGAAGWMLGRGPEGWHPNPEFFYQPGAGPMFDMGPYYLTALVSLLGPVRRLTGSTRVAHSERIIGSGAKQGQKIAVNTATHIAGVFDFASGAVATLSTSWDVYGGSTVPHIEVYGTEGTLVLPDPNCFGGSVRLHRSHDPAQQEEIKLALPYAENSRGLGLADMVAAIRENRPHRASGDLAFHVLDLMIGVHEASREGCHIQLQSSVERPALLPSDLQIET